MSSWNLKRTVQCAKCPWRKDVDPRTIPNGYCVERHCALESTIAKDGDNPLPAELHVMACHETDDAHCVGWLMNQLGPGNNLALRVRMLTCSNRKDLKLIGEQHERFEDTIPGDE